MRHALLFTVAIATLLGCSGGTPTSPIQAAQPAQVALAVGRWTSEGSACLSVASTESSLISGCWRGRFSTPVVRADGTFDVDGTFQFEAGPSRDTAGAPAHFSGTVNGTTLNLTVRQTAASATATPVSFAFTFGGEGHCEPLCV
jgi:hypothetical protein